MALPQPYDPVGVRSRGQKGQNKCQLFNERRVQALVLLLVVVLFLKAWGEVEETDLRAVDPIAGVLTAVTG